MNWYKKAASITVAATFSDREAPLLKQSKGKSEASKERSLHDWFSRKREKGSK